MDLKSAVAVARRRIEEMVAPDTPRDVRLEAFLYDDHLMVWSLTIEFALAGRAHQARSCKIVRVSESNQSVLSVTDR